MFFTTDTPNTHKFISQLERNYIVESTYLGPINRTTNTRLNSTSKTPWLLIFKSKACLAIFVRLII